ncbi:MAG: adenylate/guanylate cyclase domain-containing protein, partial [Planctomycetales bacterium]
GHLQYIKRAASLLDTFILSRQNVEVTAKRYYKHVGTGVYEVLRESPGWLEPRQEQVVILSADLVGSTEYAHAETNPFAVFRHINAYLGMIGKIVKSHNGALDKYLGDEVMGFFGAPVPDSKRSINALNCALRILADLEVMNEQRTADGEPTFQVKITIGLVDCVVGEVGSPETQTDYTVIGRDVNQFFRIATHGEPNAVIVNEAYREEMKDTCEFEFVGRAAFKGVDKELAIHRLVLEPTSSEE